MGESLKTLEGFRGGPLKFTWKMKTRGGGGGIAKVIKLLGGFTSVK